MDPVGSIRWLLQSIGDTVFLLEFCLWIELPTGVGGTGIFNAVLFLWTLLEFFFFVGLAFVVADVEDKTTFH